MEGGRHGRGLVYQEERSCTVLRASPHRCHCFVARFSGICRHTPTRGKFLDDDFNVHEGMIEAIAAIKVTLGCNIPDHYCPSDSVRRDQMASFLARALELEDSVTDWFTDDNDNVHEANINKVADAGITLGIGGGLYDPTALVSRAQMASFLAQALELPDSVIDWFPDDNGNVHESNINKIADDGVTLGCGGGFYCPSANVSRDQMASFIGRALKLDPIFPDHFPPAWPSGAAISVTGASDISFRLIGHPTLRRTTSAFSNTTYMLMTFSTSPSDRRRLR